MSQASLPLNKPATSEDWERLRDVVTRLYIDEDKTVGEVKRYMERNHNFFATIATYKKKLGSWNAFKNLRPGDVLQILRLRKYHDADQKTSTLLVRGKIVDPRSLQVYIARNPWLLAEAEAQGPLGPDAVQDVTCRSPNPLSSPSAVSNRLPRFSGRARTPDVSKKFIALLPSPRKALPNPQIYAAPEGMFRALHGYINRCFATRFWSWSDNRCWNTRGRYRPSALLNSFLDRIMTAALSVTRQVNVVVVRHALDAAFAVLIRIFRNPPPDTIPKLLTVAIRLSRIGRDEIRRILFRFSRDLAFALGGPRDLLTIFWQRVMDTDDSQRLDATERILALCLSEFEKRTGRNHDLPTSVYLLNFDIFERLKQPQAQLQSVKRQLEKVDCRHIDRRLLSSLLLERQLAICKMELEEGRSDRAEAALLDLDVDHVNPKDEPFRLAWLGYVRWIRGNLPAAEQSYRDGFLAAERTGSRDVVCEALFQLEKFLSCTGQPLESEAVRARRFGVVQRMGSIVCVDADDGHVSDCGDTARGSVPSVLKIRIASGAIGDKWRPSAFAELVEGPGALLGSGEVAYQVAGLEDEARGAMPRATPVSGATEGSA
ncbi:hypothetical protein DL770_007869 [Monosporascus sp. CRB-9-2]|nr:hypothetical protein DL770_007869 [Monosporascus sp. CRB-9-2]